MSASIKYEHVAPRGVYLGVMTPGWFIRAIEEAFGVFPVELTERDIPVLRGMAAALQNNTPEKKAFLTLIDAIVAGGTVRVFAEN